MEQQTGSNLGKEYVNTVFGHSAYLTCIQSTLFKMLDWDESQAGIKVAWRNINNLKYADDTTLMSEREEELKNLLMRVKQESEKSSLNIWKFSVHVLLKPDLENFEHCFASVCDEFNAKFNPLALSFFGIGMKTDLC